MFCWWETNMYVSINNPLFNSIRKANNLGIRFPMYHRQSHAWRQTQAGGPGVCTCSSPDPGSCSWGSSLSAHSSAQQRIMDRRKQGRHPLHFPPESQQVWNSLLHIEKCLWHRLDPQPILQHLPPQTTDKLGYSLLLSVIQSLPGVLSETVYFPTRATLCHKVKSQKAIASRSLHS